MLTKFQETKQIYVHYAMKYCNKKSIYTIQFDYYSYEIDGRSDKNKVLKTLYMKFNNIEEHSAVGFTIQNMAMQPIS